VHTSCEVSRCAGTERQQAVDDGARPTRHTRASNGSQRRCSTPGTPPSSPLSCCSADFSCLQACIRVKQYVLGLPWHGTRSTIDSKHGNGCQELWIEKPSLSSPVKPISIAAVAFKTQGITGSLARHHVSVRRAACSPQCCPSMLRPRHVSTFHLPTFRVPAASPQTHSYPRYKHMSHPTPSSRQVHHLSSTVALETIPPRPP
jgi:hypothetical protein